MEPFTIDAGRVRLRPYTAADIDAIVETARDPEAQHWTPVRPGYHRADAQVFVDLADAHWADNPPTAYEFAIADPATDRYLGNVGLRLLHPGVGRVGYFLHPDARGRGAVTAALRALAGWAFAPPEDDGLGVEVLQWRAHVGNWASRRAAWAVGFRIEALVRGLLEHRGELRDAWVGTLRRGDPLRPATPWPDAPRISGERCVLRAPRIDDAVRITEGRNDPLSRHFLTLPDPPATVERSVRMVLRQREQQANGTDLHWTIADPVRDKAVGGVSLMEFDHAVGTAEVGYWLHPEGRGQGVASEAVRLAVRHAFTPADDGGLGLRRLSVEAVPSNDASLRVAERAGFRPAGRRRLAERLGDGSWSDLVVLDLLAEEAER